MFSNLTMFSLINLFMDVDMFYTVGFVIVRLF